MGLWDRARQVEVEDVRDQPISHTPVHSPSRRENQGSWLSKAGLRSEVNVDEFIGMQLLWGVLLPIVLTLLNLLLDLGFPWWAFVALAPIGFLMPRMHANAMRRERVISIRLDLPFFVDLLALSMEAGLDFQGAVQRIVERAKGKGSHLCEEFENFLRDLTMGDSRAKALRSMAYRCDMGEVNSFVNVIVDADQTGASIAKVLKDQSVQMRLERFVRAEKAGARASQLILLPLMLFILPAVFVMIFAPVALQFMYGKG
jgi:tight adherence protein C